MSKREQAGSKAQACRTLFTSDYLNYFLNGMLLQIRIVGVDEDHFVLNRPIRLS